MEFTSSVLLTVETSPATISQSMIRVEPYLQGKGEG